MRRGVAVLIIATLVVASLVTAFLVYYSPRNSNSDKKPFYFGVSFYGETVEEAKLLIDRVKNFTNLFIIGTTGISYNETKLTETCQYLVDHDMYFMIYSDNHRRLQVISDIVKKYGDNFLGHYFDNEQGGRQLDLYDYRWVYEADNYTDASNQFVQGLKWWLNRRYYQNRTWTPAPSDFHLFTYDYALYWFDYKAGYDTVFAEFGWNNTIAQEIGLVRGAAKMQNKSWGTIITWTYNHPPYLASGDDVFDQMRLSYECGAEYVVVFNYAKDLDGPYGILQDEHFEAMELLWNEVAQNPKVVYGGIEAEAVLVLPNNYGWGMRNPNDKIWGLWDVDDKSEQIWDMLQKYLEQYGTQLDIIYDDVEFPFEEKYSQIYYWNQTG